MRKMDRRQGLMLCAAGLLVVVMMTVFVRLGTTHILVKRAHMDNVITRTILYDNAGLQLFDSNAPQGKIDWERAYPFVDIDGRNKKADLPTEKIESKVASVEKKIDEWTGKYLLGYYKLAEVGRGYEAGIDWDLISPTRQIVPLEDGVWSGVCPKVDISERAISITDLADTASANGANFLYIQAPYKIDKYGDFAVNGRFDFANQNADDLIMQLQSRGISILDLRDTLHNWARTENIHYHDFFFHTDHHWKQETALRVAKVVGDRLQSYGIPVDNRHYDLQDYDVEILPEFFLGSSGKRATLVHVKADDFPILHPRFSTCLHFTMPELGIDEVGTLEITYDQRIVEHKDYYGTNSYGMYGYGDRSLITIENLLAQETDKKVLLIKDSFSDTMGPLLSLGIRNLIMLDLRVFTGSVKAYIRDQKPDVVILMYNPGTIGGKTIDWFSHKDLYDFR